MRSSYSQGFNGNIGKKRANKIRLTDRVFVYLLSDDISGLCPAAEGFSEHAASAEVAAQVCVGVHVSIVVVTTHRLDRMRQ